MSRLHKDSTIPSVASTSQEGQENRTLQVTLLSTEWKSSTEGDLSTINRELAIQLAKHSNVDVSVLLPNCSKDDRSGAESHNVKVIEADRVPGLKPIFCLSSPPRNHIMDCVIGHGVHLGQQIALIKGNPHYCHCKWIQVVHSAPEEVGMYKNISEGEQMQQTEIELCKMADQVVTIGPKLADVYKHYLCRGKRQQNVFDLTPSIFSEFLEVEQSTEERRTFCVLVIGSGDSHEDFNVKGYDIAAKAIAELKGESYKLRFICPPGGKGDEMAGKLLRHGISRNQLIVRSFNDSREVLANLFCEVDLAIMPSRTEGFGITALEALSAGLPILVSGNSGLGEALKEVPLGSYCVVDSDDPKDWAREIKNVCQKKREVRLKEARFLRANYLEKYSWEEPCRSLVERMYKLTFGSLGRGSIFPIRDKRPTSIFVADQPPKRLRKGLSHVAPHKAAEGPSIGRLPQSTMECVQSPLPTVTVSQDKLVDQRSYTQSLNRRPPSGHGQNPYAGASSTDYGGFVHQECHPHGQNRHLSFELGQNLYAGASSTHYRGPVHQGCHTQAVDSSQGNLPTAFANLSNQGSQTFLQIQNRHPSTEHGHYPFVGASSIYNSGVIHQGYQPQGSFSYGLPAPVAVNYNQGNLPVPLVNTSHQGNQTFPQSSFPYGVPHLSVGHSQSLSPSAVTRNEDPIHWGSHTQSDRLAIVCSLLKQEYKKRSQLKPLFWDNTIQLPLEDVYTRLKILSRRKRDFQLEKNEVSMFEIFKNGNDTIVLVEGSPGMGKTTFCLKIAHDWAIRVISELDSFPEFEVVLLLKCRDIHGDIKEAIDEQLLPKRTSEAIKRELFDYIEDFHYQKKVLIILDGLDELPKMVESDVDSLLQKQIFPFCYILATSRQERGIVVRKKVDFHLLLQIEGFRREDAFDYIRKHFKNAGPEHVLRGERLIAEIRENTLLDALWNNPLNLLLLCIVFEDYQGELPSYRTELYQIIVCCILRRYCAKHDQEASVDDRNLVSLFKDSLLVLGELAWRCLEEDRFSFREEELAEFESANANLAARKLGLVFKEASLRKINPQHEYFFFHKTFQEYLAAFYLANKLLIKEVDFFELHSNFYNDIQGSYRQVFIFMSGILGEDAGLIFEQIGKKLKEEDWDWHGCSEEDATFFVECFNESRNDEQVAIALSSFIPFPQTMTFDLTEEFLTTDVFIVLKACGSFSQLQLPVHLAIESFNGEVTIKEVCDALADIIASNTQLQTLSFSGCVSEEITALLCKALTVDSSLHSFTLETTKWISSREVDDISDTLAANKTLTTVTLKLPFKVLKSCVAILDKGLSAESPLTSVVLKIFGSWRETEAEDFKKILLNTSLTSLSLTLIGDGQDSVITSVSEGLVANPSLKSLALTFYGKLSNSSVALLKDCFLGNRSLESLELKVFGELPTNWANISRTLHSAVKSTMSFTLHPNVTGMVGTSQVACLCPVLNKNLLASKLHSLAVNIMGELDCSGANDLCKGLIASSVSCVTLNFKERVTDNVANCLFKHLNKLKTLSKLTISIQGELMGDRKNTLERLSRNQTYLFALNVSDSYSGNKICREVGLSADDSSSLTPVLTKVKDGCVTKLSVSVNNPDSISGNWGSTLCEGLAKIESLTTLSLTFNNSSFINNMDALWDATAKNKSLTTLSLTLNSYNEYVMSEPITCGLSNGLAKNSSLTTLSLTLNDGWVWEKMVGDDLSDSLAKNTSLTTLSLTFNIQSDSNIDQPLMNYLSYVLAKNMSLTTLSLTLNNYCDSDWEGHLMSDLSYGLTENMSLTTLSLTLNNYRHYKGCMISHLNEGLTRNMSLTTLILTLNNHRNFNGCMISGLSDRWTKNMSLTTLSLTLNNYRNFNGCMISGLSDWLAQYMSLTTLSLAINNYSSFDGDLTDGVIDGLANNKSLTTLSLTLNDHSYRPNSCFHALKNALVKNTSIVTLNLTLSNYNNLYEDWIHELADALARDTSLSSISLELNVFSERNSNSESSLV